MMNCIRFLLSNADRIGGDVSDVAVTPSPLATDIDHTTLVLANGQKIVGSDLSVFINSLGGLSTIFSPANIIALLNLFFRPTPAPAPTPVPPSPAPAPFNLAALLTGLLQLLQQFQPVAPVVPGPTPTPSPVPTPPKMMALPVEKRPSKEDVLNDLKAKGVAVGMILIPLLVMLIQLAIQFGLPFIQSWLKPFTPAANGPKVTH